jgi:dTDP-glucose pyrophosphorylase
MKILIPAAGRGTRINAGSSGYIPKVVFSVGTKPLCYWAHRVFKRWITAGLINQDDIIFIIRDVEDRKYNLTETIKKNTHPNVNVMGITEITRGPSETVNEALKHLNLDSTEPVFMSDCDHYFSSGGLVNAIQVDDFPEESDILLSVADTNSVVPSWSYARLDEGGAYPRVLEIREKDPKMALAGAPGVVGCYGFKSIDLFQSLFKALVETCNTSEELYMSSVVAVALAQKKKVAAAYSRFAYPLGTTHEIEEFLNILPAVESGFEDRSIFCDVDGVLLRHQAGPSSPGETFHYPASPVQNNVSLLVRAFRDGHYIALTTSRRESERADLTCELARLGIRYQDLIMGIADGPRYLLNDRRPQTPQFDRAIALNVERDNEFPMDLIEANRCYGDLIMRNLTSGSGAVTLELRRANSPDLFIRKIVQTRNTSHVSVLKLQANWYRAAAGCQGKVRVPTVLAEFSDGVATVLDIERFDELSKLTVAIKNINNEQVGEEDRLRRELLEPLFVQLNELYEAYRQENCAVYCPTKSLFYERLIPAFEVLSGYMAANHSIRLDLDSEIILNDRSLGSLTDLTRKIEDVISRPTWSDIEQPWSTLIHGDLTAENILITPEGIALIDPLGAKMDLYHQTSRYGLGLTSPFFDYLKLLQSLLVCYEDWKDRDEDLLWNNGGVILQEKKPSINSRDVRQISAFFRQIGVSVGLEQTKINLCILLFRLIPYRLSINPRSALLAFIYGMKIAKGDYDEYLV